MRPLLIVIGCCAIALASNGRADGPALSPEILPSPATSPPAHTDVPVDAQQPQSATNAQVQAEAQRRDLFDFEPDPDHYQIISAGKGLTLHKPMYVLPFTYSAEHNGRNTEMLFQISLKQRLFGVPLYFAYSQKSFFDYAAKNAHFRENDYNPELFYRFTPAAPERWHHLGADIGIEHESNGKGLPDERSWNRVYIAPFQNEGEHTIYWKWWWRLPESKGLQATNPNRDDNPDIGSFYGYSELHYEQQLFKKNLMHLMGRYNPATGRGAVSLQYTIPNSAKDPSFFWMLYVWQGYGESLIDYNRSITRVGIGVALAR